MAGPFSHDFIESVRSAGDIVRLVSDFVPLKKAGSRLKGLCPFHEEKTPSFSVDPERQLFYCFGCQTGGDIFKFLMLYEKLAFGEAVETLAKRWGVPLPGPRESQKVGPEDRLARINKVAETFFRSSLTDPQVGKACRAYLRERGIDEATESRLAIGYAPDAWEALRSHLLGKRVCTAQELLAAGLVLSRQGGSGEYDRFRGRLIFPIRDSSGRTVAFGGRSLGDAQPKYLNSPETPAYRKGEQLYGLDLAREAIRREGFAIVVEGYFDLAAVVQAGFANVVATLGTSFTPAQARLLARTTSRVLFSYDGDAAGAAATERSLDLLLSKSFDVRVVELPAGCDPDDFLREHGAAAYRTLLDEAPEYLEFLIRRESRQTNLRRIEEKVAAVNRILPHVARLAGPIERGTWATRLADALDIDDDLVRQELRSAIRSARPRIRQRAETERPLLPVEARLVSELLRSEEEQRRFCECVDLAELEGAEVLPIVRVIVDLVHEGRRADYPAVLGALESEADQDLLNRIAFREEPETGPTIEDCMWTFRRERLLQEGRKVRRRLGDLQETRSTATPADIDRELMRLQDLARRRDALSSMSAKSSEER